MRNKILMTLALLLTAVTGAWAEEATITLNCGTTEKTFEKVELPWSSTADILKEVISDFKMGPGIQSITGGDGKVVKNGNENFQVTGTFSGKATVEVSYVSTSFSTLTATITVTAPGPAEPAIDVKWDPATKSGSFVMPAYDVEIAPIYAPVAQWAKVDNVDQLPTAIEGVYAESTDAIVTAGTVAKIGETGNPQGTVMYAVTSTNQATAPALDAFSADVPTAENITAAGDVLVWYYIKGADAPEGEKATAENTFNDSEICAEPIKVTVLSNKFDIQFKAANDNTIDAGKATVTVGGTAATVTDGKLEGVKMGTEVKVTAKDGYKFRKVEVKKGAKADLSETITFSGGKNANYTYTGTHFSATGEADPTDGTFELNKWSSVTINATDGKTITKVVFSYRENGNNDLDLLSFSSGTFDGIDTVNDVNATTLIVTSTTVGATKLNGVTIYYK